VSIITFQSTNPELVDYLKPEIIKKDGTTSIKETPSIYQPEGKERLMLTEIRHAFTLGHVTMYKPRREFNDLSLLSRYTVDKMAFNTYQPNDGDALEGDELNSWKSRAVKPLIRNKIMSIAAHATARLLFPKVFAYNKMDEDQEELGQVMEDLQEWTADQSNYAKTSLYAVITALYSPASIIETDYVETYREVKRGKENGKWTTELILDEELSGFNDMVVPIEELYIENFYEPNIQRQGWLLKRKVISYALARAKYERKYPNFEYVKPGIQTVYNDANQTFYDVYDTNMRQDMTEEITFWRKADDVKIIMVNGIMMTDPENPNPRNDKMYPFSKFGYSLIDEGRCFYYKSLAFHMSQDFKAANTLYQMIIDGTYLNVMKPMVNRGGEFIAQDVIIPGAVTTLSDPDAQLEPLNLATDLKAGMDTLAAVEQSINESTESNPVQNPVQPGGDQTAYQISMNQQNSNTVLGLFIKMISDHVKQFGKLRLGDILQYLTLPNVQAIEGKDESELVYKAFYLYNKNVGGRSKTRKIKFDANMPNKELDKDEYLAQSYQTLKEQGGLNSKTELYKVNPILVKDMKYMVTVSADTLNPMSEELERAFGLELYDRAIQNQILDQEEVTRHFLLGVYPQSKRDPDKFINKNPQQQGATGTAMQPGQQPGQPAQKNVPPKQGVSPLQALGAMSTKQMNPMPAG
jgi:hypothetical protein